MNKSHQIIIGTSCQSESPKFLVMAILVPLVIKTEIINSFYIYKFLGQPNKKKIKRAKKHCKDVLLPKHSDLSFPLTEIQEF